MDVLTRAMRTDAPADISTAPFFDTLLSLQSHGSPATPRSNDAEPDLTFDATLLAFDPSADVLLARSPVDTGIASPRPARSRHVRERFGRTSIRARCRYRRFRDLTDIPMNPNIHSSQYGETFDDALLDTPDGPETLVLAAIRTWRRPHCDGQPARLDWNRMLADTGLRSESIERFDLVMHVLTRASARPFETFCRCATTLTSDEATLLQAIGLLQRTQSAAAVALLNEWRALSFVSELLKLIRWLAIDLLDAGIEIRVRERETTYMH